MSAASGVPAKLAGAILLAHPSLRDENFRRTVVLMSVHNDDGAMGVVVNRPLGRTLGQVNGAFAYGPLAEIPVFSGGPVQTEQLILIAWQQREDGYRLHFGMEPAQAEQLALEHGTLIHAYLGYAGWEAGQLENEMRQRTWVAVPMTPEFLGQSFDEGLWRTLLASLGPEWRLLSGEPEDSSTN